MTLPRRNDQRRTGAALMWVLVILAVLSVTSATAVWQIGAARRGLALRHNRLQAVWLARSGCELAAARLLADPEGYTGESIETIADAKVKIAVERDASRPDAYRVRCEARYPVGDRSEVSRSTSRLVTRRTDGDRRTIEMTLIEVDEP
jgi:hypothetical protein